MPNTPFSPADATLVHPTYGTLEAFLVELARDLERGYVIRLGQMAALTWYAEAFGRLQIEECPLASQHEDHLWNLTISGDGTFTRRCEGLSR